MRIRCLLSFFLSFTLVFFIFCPTLHAQSVPDPLCGPKSLQVVFQKLGVKSSLEEVSRLSGYNDKEGTTMSGLYQAARKKGFCAEGVKISLDEIANLKIPIIAYLWDNHFLVVEGTGTDTLIITDPPKEPQLIPKDKFQPFYSGFALIISKDKISLPISETKEVKSDIRFDNYTYDFGKIEPGQKIERTFVFKNAGDKELTVSNVRTTCGCTAALLSDKNIPSKGKGEIKVSFDTTGRSGLENQKIFVHSNDSITPIVQLQIQGLVKADLAISPRNIAFGDIKKGTISTREIYITDQTGENVKVTKVESYPSFLSAIFSSITVKSYQGYKVLISLSPNTPLCSLEGKVTIYTTDKKHLEIEIPVTANIIGDIEFYPSMFFFGFVKQGSNPTAIITISTTGAAPLKIERVENGQNFISTKFISTSEGKKYKLTATLSKDIPKGNIKGTITIYTDNPDQPRIEIPIFGFVE